MQTNLPQPKLKCQKRPNFSDVPETRRRNLAAVGSRDTEPEIAVRSLLHRMGYRFRLQRRDLPGRPDIVLPGRRTVIDVRGCFWHRHPDPRCKNAVLPRTRAKWWAAKLASNVTRDAVNEAKLKAAGWRVLILWECEVGRDPAALERKLAGFLGSVRSK